MKYFKGKIILKTVLKDKISYSKGPKRLANPSYFTEYARSPNLDSIILHINVGIKIPNNNAVGQKKRKKIVPIVLEFVTIKE